MNLAVTSFITSLIENIVDVYSVKFDNIDVAGLYTSLNTVLIQTRYIVVFYTQFYKYW